MDGAYELAEGGRCFNGPYVYVDILSGRLSAGTGVALLTADGTLEWLDRPEDRTPSAAA